MHICPQEIMAFFMMFDFLRPVFANYYYNLLVLWYGKRHGETCLMEDVDKSF